MQALLGVVVPVAAYFISLRLFGRRVSYLSAIGLIFYPHLVYFNAWLIAESLFMALMVTALWAIGSVVEKPIVARIALAGVLFGLASLTKPFMLFVMPFLALWLLLASNGRLSRRLMSVAILTVAMVGVILPWTIRNYRLFDQVVLISTNGGYTFLGANNPNAWGGSTSTTRARSAPAAAARDRCSPRPVRPGINASRRRLTRHKWGGQAVGLLGDFSGTANLH